ncbi:MAG: InlB B-repeat-containing protein [Treponema sp.]|nr:InlB B-repeat-containing protein [Treponema sp.]
MAFYRVSFYNNGEVYDSQSVQSGTRAQRPANPEDDENLRFVGWYENPNFTKRFIFNKAVDTDVNLYARFINISYIPIGEETTVEEIDNSTIFISGRDITIPSLYVCDHEVTQAEWSEYMKVSSGLAKTGDNYPIHKINWYECIMYCNLRSEAEGLVPAYYVTVDGEDIYDVATPITGANAFDENGNNRQLKCVRRGGCYTNQEYSVDTGNYPTGCNVNTRGQPKTPYEKNNYGGLRGICTAN